MAGSKPRTGAIDHLRAWLLRRWNPDARMLDLSVSDRVSLLAVGTVREIEAMAIADSTRHLLTPPLLVALLQRMATDTYLLEREVFPPGHKNTRHALSKVLWKLVAELKPPVRCSCPSPGFVH